MPTTPTVWDPSSDEGSTLVPSSYAAGRDTRPTLAAMNQQEGR